MDIHCRGEVTSPLRKRTLGNIVDVTSPLHKPTLRNIAAYFKYQSTKLMKELQNMQDYIDNNIISWTFEKEHPKNIPL
jgi:hypothetical protein